MFDVGWSEVLIIGVVALLVVGPKELPALLRTIGKYVGMIKRQASEFRAQFDEALRETELEKLKKDVEQVGRDVQSTLREAQSSVEKELDDARREFDSAAHAASPQYDSMGVPIETSSATADPPPSSSATSPAPLSPAAAAAAAAAKASATTGA